MKLQSVRPILWTEQMQETIDFYTGVLGFSVGEKNDEWGWASLYKDQVEIMLAKPNQHEGFEKPVFTGSFYFNTNDVESLWHVLKHKAKIVYDIETFEWQMREFAIYDNNGYILQFGQDISTIKSGES